MWLSVVENVYWKQSLIRKGRFLHIDHCNPCYLNIIGEVYQLQESSAYFFR